VYQSFAGFSACDGKKLPLLCEYRCCRFLNYTVLWLTLML